MLTLAGLYNTYAQIFKTGVWPIVGQYFVYLAPVFAAILLGILFWEVWMKYVRQSFFLELKYTILELRLPRDTFKSPLAMETVLHAIHNTADTSWYNRIWNGEVRPWYSLEIISIEGQVKFLIWTEDRRKSNLKSALYSQYPGIEIHEIEDYSKDIQWDPKVWKVWASEFQLVNKNNAYPIKTYVDYGLDKDPKEEFKIDPLVHLLEWMGSLRPNEQAWFQFIITAHKAEHRKPGTLWSVKDYDALKEDAKKAVNEILLRDPKTKVAGEVNPETGFAKLPTITKGEQEIVASIERKVQKLVFDTCIRTLYIAKREVFDTPFGIGGCISSLKQFNAEHLNGFKPGGKLMPGSFDYPWQDYQNTRRNYYSKRVLMAYRRRSAFYPPIKGKVIYLNTEELATIYHLPGQVAGTPTLTRIPSKKGEAPVNLPV
jgi:hypothetical protein